MCVSLLPEGRAEEDVRSKWHLKQTVNKVGLKNFESVRRQEGVVREILLVEGWSC